jgi:hypothetical protein
VLELEERARELDRRDQFELVRRLMTHLEESDHALQQERLRESVELLRQWAAEPDDVDEEAWAEFERLLRERRPTFRRVEFE